MGVASAMPGFVEKGPEPRPRERAETLRALESCGAAARMELRSFEGRMLGHEADMEARQP